MCASNLWTKTWYIGGFLWLLEWYLLVHRKRVLIHTIPFVGCLVQQYKGRLLMLPDHGMSGRNKSSMYFRHWLSCTRIFLWCLVLRIDKEISLVACLPALWWCVLGPVQVGSLNNAMLVLLGWHWLNWFFRPHFWCWMKYIGCIGRGQFCGGSWPPVTIWAWPVYSTSDPPTIQFLQTLFWIRLLFILWGIKGLWGVYLMVVHRSGLHIPIGWRSSSVHNPQGSPLE